MKTMEATEFEHLIEKDGKLTLKHIGMDRETSPHIHYDLGCVTILAVQMARDYLAQEGESGTGVQAFTVDSDLNLAVHDKPSSYQELKEIIHANEEGAMAYIVMVMAPRLMKTKEFKGTDDEINDMLGACNSAEEVRALSDTEGLEYGFSAVVTVGTHDTVWSVSILDTKEIEIVAFSDYEGDSPVEIHMHSLDYGSMETDFSKLFHQRRIIPLSEWKMNRYGPGSADKLQTEGDDFAGPAGVELIEKLCARDGHDNWKLSYACLRKLCDIGDAGGVPKKHRMKLIALFQSRINELEAANDADGNTAVKKPTHKAPGTVQ